MLFYNFWQREVGFRAHVLACDVFFSSLAAEVDFMEYAMYFKTSAAEVAFRYCAMFVKSWQQKLILGSMRRFSSSDSRT